MKTIHHVLDVESTRADAWRLLGTAEGLATWWSTEVALDAAEVGRVVDFTFLDGFHPDMEIIEVEPERSLTWRCIGGHDPWADNTFRFELEDLPDGKVRLRFWQHYATELSDDEYGIYNFNWGFYLESLRLVLVEGRGHPYDPALGRTT